MSDKHLHENEAKRESADKKDALVRCVVRNCQKILESEEIVKIGNKIFCKTCAVEYVKSFIGV